LGDSEGYLYLLTLEISNLKVVEITSTIIAQVSLPSTIVDLGNNLLYIGSSQGDPCVVRLSPNTAGKYTLDILHTFSNLGPIVDFCLFDYDGQGKQTMVCCSGVDRDGSLRILENGVGFLEEYILNIPLLNNIWTLPNNTLSPLLMISTTMETIILKSTSDHLLNEMREYQTYSGLILNEITLTTVVTQNNHILQVTPSSVRLVQYDPSGNLLFEWKPPKNDKIAIAKANATQCVICYGSGILVYLEIADNVLVQKW
jgi:DNA damage-binding protein 1